VHSAIPIDPGTATFVDLGTGRGRPLILAAEMGFRRVVGVELDGTLVREAEANVRGWRARRGHRQKPGQVVDVVLGDAATYTPPDGPVVMWLFNPFGPVTLRYVLRNVCDTPRSGELFIAYNNAFHRSVFEEFPRLATWAEGKRWAVYRLGPLGQQPSGTA
jgi:SAM-dependent methyltransferase